MKRYQIIISIFLFFVFSLVFSQKIYAEPATFYCADFHNNGTCVRAGGDICPNDLNDVIANAYCSQFANDCSNAPPGNCNTCLSNENNNVCQNTSCSSGFLPATGTCADPSSVCCVQNLYTPSPTPTLGVIYCYKPNIGSDKWCACNDYDSFVTITGECNPEETGEYIYNSDQCRDYCEDVNNGPIPTPSVDKNRFCNGKDDTDGINTALGCIKVGSSDDLITFFLRLATGLGGGLALALILYGVFIVTTSAGVPDKLKSGSEIITSAIIGLIFILLSIFLINLIGINILGIPGLS